MGSGLVVSFFPLLFQLLLETSLLHANPESGASFFGDGYLEMPLASTYNTVQLHIQFYTSQRNGLLFLAAGQTNYLLLELSAGVLQARMDLGSEELTIKSPAGPYLNDLVIHDADLLVADRQMTLMVDGLFNASVEIPGPLQELDVEYGLYVGGTGSLELPYLVGVSTPFRGCLHAVTFNDRDVLSALGSAAQRSRGVQEGCSIEFSAGPDDPLGFLGPNSYIAFPGWSARNEGSIEFVITTSVKQAPLIYQSGLENDFFYLDIVDGRLRGIVEKGNGQVVLHNNVYLSNEQDHYVKVYMDVRKFEILVDYYASQTSNKGIHSHLDLQGPLFVGGLNEKAAARMREHGLARMSGNNFSNSSFVGCIEDLRVNQEKRSLQDALVTRNITAGCGKLEEYSDYSDSYEQDEATTSSPLDDWQGPVMEPCHPDPNLPPIFANFTKLLHVSPLVVAEGGTAFLEWRHAQPTIDLSSANIRQSQVLFSVTTDPRHGELQLDISRARNRRKFTLLDIVNRKVKYVHDGSESPMDQLLLEVTVTARGEIPECLWQGQIYLLPIKVNPVNDAPEIIFPHGDRIVILEHTRKQLNPDIFQALDDDTPCDSLRFQLLGGKRVEEGFVEYDFHPGVPIEEFSCRDLEAGHVAYIHQNGPTSSLMIQVNDGMVMSPVATLRIVAVEPDIQVRNNTGLHVAQGGVVPITTANLSVETNAVQQKVPVLYRLTMPLQYGEIQKQSGEWKKVESFHQQDVEQGRIQYVSTDEEQHTEDMIDKLEFIVQVGQKILRNNTFLIRITRATIKMKTMVPLQMKHEKEMNITTVEMEAALEEPSSSLESYHYTIIQPPKKGNLELCGMRLVEGFGFTQEDLQNHQLRYSVTIRDSKETEDSFQFRIMSGAHYSPIYTYKIQIGGDPEAPVLTNTLLSILEGGQAIISKDHLFIKSANNANYLYEVIDGPTNGKLMWRTSKSSPSSEEVITKFTNEDILQGRLVYQHDDSETLEDDIPFVAIKQIEGSSDLDAEDVRGVFRVSIQPVNDHTPVQAVNKVFNVVRNGQRLMTTNDIAFLDEDSGFSDTQLVFVRKDILFGSIIAADDRSRQVYRFTQDDLRMKRILFVHSGADRGWIQFQVSDGLHQVATLLEVQASDPYIKIHNRSDLIVHQGSQATLDSSILSLETNMDIRNDEDILFRIIAPPKWGVVLRDGQEVSSFTQKDLLAGDVLYHHHNGSKNPQDKIHVSVEANQVTVEEVLEITVHPDSQPDPLKIVHNERIHILQGEAVEIKSDYLLVEHEDIPPHEILYTVTIPPLSGFLVALSQGHTPDEPITLDPIQTFTQEDINEGKVLYLQSSPEIDGDQFTVDITANGVDALDGVVVGLDILPISIPLEVHNFTVTEGSSQVLSMDVLNIPGTYFTTLHVEFVVLEAPEHGVFQNVERPDEDDLNVFSWYEVEHQLIRYIHDGSESLTDRFTVVANISKVNQQSRPKTVNINIIPTNDEAPILVVNLGLQIQEDAMAEITPELLLSKDEDSPPEEVVYSIRRPINGKVVLKSSPNDTTQRFTQAQINSRLVEFVHKGALDGGFSFDLSDGENMSPGHFFAVRAQKKLTLILENKEDLAVCPGTFQPIRSQNLKAVTNDDKGTQSLLYIVDQPPQFGRLLNNQKDNNGEQLRNFTQSEVDNGVISYHHEMPSEPFWSLEDAFHFRLSSPSTTTDPYVLGVSVSFENGCPQGSTRLWRNKGLTLPEAQSKVIDISLLDASNLLVFKEPGAKRRSYDVLFLVTQLPAHGTLSVPDGPVNREHPYFLQSDLAAGGLEYAHHGPGTMDDHFRFSAWLRPLGVKSIQPPQKEEGPVISGIFNITVKDSNEVPPRLVSQEHVLRVLHGSSLVISQDHLNVKDPDSSPEEIKYDILSGSSSGFVTHVHNKQVPVSQFTQADINTGRIMFIANGTSSSGTLDFAISDGHNPTIFTSLEIMVVPAITWATNQTLLEIPQDINVAPLSHDHLLGTLDEGEHNALYRIIGDPQFGQIEVNQKPVKEFSQKQVDDGEVLFTFTDFVSSEDGFQFLATSGEVNISGVVSVAVKALVKTQQDALWPRGTTIQLDTSILDASELANRTKSNPEFKILQGPQRSQFVKVSRDPTNQIVPIDTFTQHDLEQGLVGLEIWEVGDPEERQEQDSFQFELAAEGVPPALESLGYITEAFNSTKPYGVTLLKVPSLREKDSSSTHQDRTSSPQTFTNSPFESKPSSPNPSEQPVHPTALLDQGILTTVSSPGERGTLLSFIEANMFSIILPICLILLLLALILPLLFYLHKRNKTGKHNVQGTPPKYKNGTVVDQETFRKTEPNQGIPLSTVSTLEAKEAGLNSKGLGPGGQQEPELLQYCRTSNPALKNSQYWV
uniref:Chondroitin sulfate proteoglycan 4 n=1 Tax=Anolis carolinensis TaxID=28377 RepID=H9G689_ANOCA|nr:PREDICTED: chondroitin sulfate proteoglycan 4 [Anolis carolinensis]|eukprot:XP_008117382.1 PREDICTED: chondroitin sulfate proteoglycan 4 [Anolis carolinensis]